MLAISCTFIGVCLFILGSSGNGLCIMVFLRKKFRHRIITPYFIVLLCADSIYLLFRLVKLVYYSQTLFKLHSDMLQSCTDTFFARIYQHATQDWPQIFIPLIHSETYIRFSLILMSIMSVQRTNFIRRSLKFLVLPATYKETYKYKWAFLIILTAFLISYTFELAGLTLFCSKTSNRDITYNWFIYMSKYMENASYILTSTMSEQPNALKCVNYAKDQIQLNQTLFNETNSICTQNELINILAEYFDQHQKPIVNLIQKIVYYQTGERITRNEIRRKYHFHECLFPQSPQFFHKYYDFMYSRVFGFNRHTLLIVFGSVIPSLITIISNVVSLYRVRELNHLTSNYILSCRRRTDDTRRILLVITIECLFAIINSWFTDIVLALVYCQRNFSASDDCPAYLRKNYDVLVMFDMFNSISNIILHCLCGRRFRNELRRMLRSFINLIKNVFHEFWCCYFRVNCSKLRRQNYVSYTLPLQRNENSNSSNSGSHQNHLCLQIQPSERSNNDRCCDCRWYLNRRPSVINQQGVSAISKDGSQKNRTSHLVHYQSVTQRTYITKQTQGRSMRLYHPATTSTRQ